MAAITWDGMSKFFERLRDKLGEDHLPIRNGQGGEMLETLTAYFENMSEDHYKVLTETASCHQVRLSTSQLARLFLNESLAPT